jgi:Protein of unknown function (DUF3108)
MTRLLILLLSALLSLSVPAVELPPAFKATYVVRKGPLELGRATHELQYAPGAALVFLSGTDTTGLAELLFSDHIRETTHLKQDATRVEPVEYQYVRSGKRNREVSQQFEPDQGKVISRVDGQVYEYPLSGPVIDQSAYLVSLMIDLAAGGRNFSYQVAGNKDVRTYDIRHVRDEVVDTKLGKLRTVVLQRNDKQVTTMWCAVDLHFLPVKIQHEEDGSVFTAYLDSVSGITLPQ